MAKRGDSSMARVKCFSADCQSQSNTSLDQASVGGFQLARKLQDPGMQNTQIGLFINNFIGEGVNPPGNCCVFPLLHKVDGNRLDQPGSSLVVLGCQ